jgi:hypothetical protein
MKTKTQKTFRVSLAVLIPQNYEITITAKNKKEAIAKAIEEYENAAEDGHFVDIDSPSQADFDEESGDGIHVE